MNIWTFKRSACALLLGLSLAGCDEGGGFSLASSSADVTDVPERRNVALRSAQMAQGGVKLVPPDGFCIDSRSLRQNFAVLARCDSLGGRGGAQDAPLGAISVAITAAEADLDVMSVLDASLASAGNVLDRRDGADLAMAQVNTGGLKGASPVHWRGFAKVGPFLVGLKAYGPDGGAMSASAGATLLTSLARRTQAASVALDAARSAEDG